MTLERRAFTGAVEVRTEGDAGMFIEGLAVPYRQLSEDLGGFREMFMPGSFGDLAGRDVRGLWNHKSEIVLGRTPKTMTLTDGEEGLAYRIEPPKWASGYVETIERGDVNGTSFGFYVPDGGDQIVRTEEGEIIRQVIRAELVEVSPVTFPAYPQTDVGIAMRSVERWRESGKATPLIDARVWQQSLAERFLSL